MIVAAIVLFAIVSAPRLQLGYGTALAFPELRVELAIAGGTADAEETTTRFVVPIESAIRSLGEVTGTRAEVTARGASILVRFRRGSDMEVKAARLSSELAAVRAKLPPRSRIDVRRANEGGNRPSALIALTGNAGARRIADELRGARGVRDVNAYGLSEREVEIAMTSDSVPTSVALDAVQSLAPRALGTSPERKLPVVALPRTNDLRETLRAVAEIHDRTPEPRTLARVDGKPAVLLAVFRDDEVPLFAFDASLRERLRGVAYEEVWNDAAALRALLARVAVGLLLASLLFAAVGVVFGGRRGFMLGIYPLLAASIAINVFRLGAMRIDAQTIVIALIAIAAASPFAVWRLVSARNELWPLATGAAFVLMLPLAATFGSGALAPFLVPSARAFVVAALSALAASCFWMADVPSATAGRPARRHLARMQRTLLRNSATVLLAAMTPTCILLTYFGARLDPRSLGESESASLDIRVNLPAGATVAQTASMVTRVEQGLTRVHGVRHTTSLIQAGWANVALDLEPDTIKPQRRSLLLMELRSYVPFVPGMISLDERGARAVRLADDFELAPSTDSDAVRYRVLLKGTDPEALRRAFERIVSRLSRLNVRRSTIQPEWPAPSPRAMLVPRRDTSPAEAERMAARLAELTVPPAPRRLPDGRIVRVIARGAPRSPDVVPQHADVLVREPSLATNFELRNEYVPGGAMRELGRFVLPVNIAVRGYHDERIKRRTEIDRTLSTMALPAGVTLERPSLSEWTLSLEKLRLLAMAAFLPLLLFAAAAIALSSLRGAAAAVATSIAGFAAAAPMLQLTSAHVDELTLLALGGSTCCVTAFAAVALVRARERTGAAYRSQRRFTAPSVFAIAAVIAMLIVPALSPAAASDGWRAPLLASLAVLGAGIPAALLVAPAIGFVARDLRRRRTAVARAAGRPVEWHETLPLLAVRNLTKRYGDGFRALHRVSFELRPGIIGLLGPNGAGKTTLLRVLTGLLLPTRGQVLYRGVAVGPHNLAEYRRLVGFLPQEFNAYARLTAFDFLDYWALERGMTDARVRRGEVERLLALVGLADDARRRVRDFSGGMRQRIGIARALLGDPPLLVVDEPTTGLDLESRNRFRDLLTTLAAERIIILSTHIAGDAEAIASRILLLAKGTLRWDGPPEELIARGRGRVFDTIVPETEARALTHHFRVTTRQRVAGGIHVRGVVPADTPLPGPPAEPTLEEAYLAELAEDRALRASGFAFLFAGGGH